MQMRKLIKLPALKMAFELSWSFAFEPTVPSRHPKTQCDIVSACVLWIVNAYAGTTHICNLR